MRVNPQKVKIHSLFLSVLLPTVFSLTSVCSAEDSWSRKGKDELLLIVRPVTIEKTTSSKYGAELEMEDTTFYGFGAGQNLDDHFNLNFDAAFFTNFDFKLITGGTVIDHSDVDSMSMNLNLDYNIFKDRLTPLVSAGVGFIRFDGDWDNTLFSNFSETDLTYNLGVGARWDIMDNIGFKAIYRSMWVDMKDADDTTRFDGISLSLAISF
jgi:opacity protein-like surface antigen